MQSELLNNKKVWLCLLFLLFGLTANMAAGVYLKNEFKDSLPILNDMILSNLPEVKIAWMYDIFMIIPLVLFIIYAFHKKMDYIPYFMILFGVIQLIRAVFIVLTPMGNPSNHVGLFVSTSFRYGLFPSGHTGSAFLAFLLSQGWYRWSIFICVIGLIISLLLAKGHYSIDIFAALIFAYAVYMFGERNLKYKLMLT
jgi:membrane-associated phospholipid phosphatase